jgi:hypothetical protein
MATSLNPDAPDFTPTFSSGFFSALAMEFSPSSLEFVPSSVVLSGLEPVTEQGGPVVPETEVATPPSVPPAPAAEPEPVQAPQPTPPSAQEPEKKEETSQAPLIQRPIRYARDFVFSLRDSCRVLPLEASIPENYSLYGSKKQGKKAKPVSTEKWATLPKYTLERGENSFANYVKNLTSEEEKEVQQLRLQINKITERNYSKLLLKLFETHDYSGFLIDKLAWFIYDRATMHHSFSEMYAKLCVDLKSKFIETQKTEIAKNFRVLILEKCEKAFYKQEVVEGNELIDAETKRRVKLAGNVKFIGFLFQLKFISPRVIHECFQVQLNEHTLSDESIETFCLLFQSVAALLRTRTKDPIVEAQELREVYERAASMRNDERFSIRVRFMIQTLMDRKNELLTGEKDVKRPEAAVLSPVKETPPPAPVSASRYRKVEYDPTVETRRIKIPAENIRELKELLLQHDSLPCKALGSKINALITKHTLHRPEVIYQVCRFALCDSQEAALEYFSSLILKSFVKKKIVQAIILEGLLLAVANIKDLQLDCPKADMWMRMIVGVVCGKEGLTEEQKSLLEARITEQMTGETAPPPVQLPLPEDSLPPPVSALSPDQKVLPTQSSSEATIREYLLTGNMEASLSSLDTLAAPKGLALGQMLKYVLMSRPLGDAARFFELVKEAATKGIATTANLDEMLVTVAQALDDIKEDCPKAPEVLQTHISALISCNAIPEKLYF